MNSWNMSECERTSIVTSIMLRFWLQSQHIRFFFKNKLKIVFCDVINDFKIEENFIVHVFVKLVKNNMLIFSFDLSVQNRQDFHQQIFDEKRFFLNFMNVAHYFSTKKKKFSTALFFSKRSFIFTTSIVFYSNQSDFCTMTSQIHADRFFKSVQSLKIAEKNVEKLLNFHIDLHFQRIMQKYDVVWNVNVLFDENKHKFFKNAVIFSNHRKFVKQILFKNIFLQTIRFLLKKFFFYIDLKIFLQI